MTHADVLRAHCPAHEELDLECVDCTIAQQDAACAHLTTMQKAKAFKAPRAKRSAVESARPVSTQTATHVAGTVLANNGIDDYWDVANPKPPAAGPDMRGTVNGRGIVADFKATPLQQPLNDGAGPLTPGPAHLSSATVAKGFLLAGNAYFTVRSAKTGTRYTYRVARGKCSRCGKTDCQCWAHPNYFVSLLTGPDNTQDYSYLGTLREGVFRLTRASKLTDDSTPVKAFRYVWEALERGVYPVQAEIWHEGRCGRCGRKLTVPESVERGIGPECAAKGGF